MQFSITRVFVTPVILREKYEIPPPNAFNQSNLSFLDLRVSENHSYKIQRVKSQVYVI
jgi:hypothetical protein